MIQIKKIYIILIFYTCYEQYIVSYITQYMKQYFGFQGLEYDDD